VSDALGNTLQFGYFAGDRVSATDPLGNVSPSFTDTMCRLALTTDTQGALHEPYTSWRGIGTKYESRISLKIR
jgi:hypothetical protein